MDKGRMKILKKFFASRTLQSFETGILRDVQDLIDGEYTVEHLKEDFTGWCKRNDIDLKPKAIKYDYTENVAQFGDK